MNVNVTARLQGVSNAYDKGEINNEQIADEDVYIKIRECRAAWSHKGVTLFTMEKIIEDLGLVLLRCSEKVYWSVVATIEEAGSRMKYFPAPVLFLPEKDTSNLGEYDTGWIHITHGTHGCRKLHHMQKAQELLKQYHNIDLSPLMSQLKLHELGWRVWHNQ